MALTSRAVDASGDGAVVVGFSQAPTGAKRAFVWDAEDGMRDLRDVLVGTYGFDLTGWTLTDANGISDDANVLVLGRNEALFIPKGSSYWFDSSGDDKLIILRTGTQRGSDRIIDGRTVPSQRTARGAQHVEPKELPF